MENLAELPVDFVEYLKQDVRVVNLALCQFAKAIQELNEQMNLKIDWDKLTSASISRQIIEQVDQRESFKVDIFTQLKAAEYYRGGFTNINEMMRDRNVKNLQGLICDAKSHYPSVMIQDVLPHGRPLVFKIVEPDEQQFIRIYETKIKENKIDETMRHDFVNIKGTILKNKFNWGTIIYDEQTKAADELQILDTYIFTTKSTTFNFKGLLQE